MISLVTAFIDQLSLFGYLSIISTIFIILSIFSITVSNLSFLIQTSIDLSPRIGQIKISGFLKFLGISLYTTEGICLVLPVR